ncbi:hypothetical protein L207DRAFT_510194 [Hyaloscypha variabilis F]|uniref:Ubiquitin interaction domain-containing protein n=1 Tax=Hyaloscypha variabilis (strain UAMH 11265 / GT02V1 / F) TaxID=1149755 RepID=A0A2J6RYT7_HYAVF|nr:hypothetical protein L207DRAFT_510194 [Hyaloscypha variabilis F]
MMAGSFQPSRGDIDAFLSLVPDVPESEVVFRLKNNNNNVEQAIGEYFDNAGSGNKYQWNEAEFSSDREGVQNDAGISFNNNAGIAFNIHAADDTGPYGPYPGAPSRPPSRTSNNKSPLSKIIDLTAEHAAADPRTSMSQQDQHDREMEQALSLSRQEYGLPPQESGITGTDQKYFGPATRSQFEYEQGNWGMVPLGKSSAQEIMLDPDPAERKRDLDVPAFLKPSVQENRLNALFTIYHEIPLTRNIFLKPMDVLPTYGYDPEWWTGRNIELPSLSGEDSPDEQTVDRELQRLMAFLDKTDRSYGSAEALANMPDVKQTQRHWDNVEPAVLAAWRQLFAEENHGMVRKVFSKGVESEEQEDTPQGTEFAILDLQVPPEDSHLETFYDITDDMLWPNLLLRGEDFKCPYLSHVADVIAFRFEGNMESYKKIDIPPIWYPDRYLKESRQAALEMRQKKYEVHEALEQASRMEDYLTSYQMKGPGGGKVVKLQDLFKASLRHDEAELEEDELRDDPDLEEITTQRKSRAATVLSAELQKIMAKIDKKLKDLNESKEKAREELRKLSKLYTAPSVNPFDPKLHPYSLRGVSVSKSTMYICRRAEPDLIDMDLDGDAEKAPKGDQWWRIHYATMGSNPVTVEKTTRDQVLEATKNEIRSAILVYASEYAMDMPAVALPKPLETFVRFDNAAFKTELTVPEESQAVGWDTEDSIDSPIDSSQPVGLSSPGKRKYRGSDDESNQYQRVNVTEKELGGSEEAIVDGHLGNGGIMEDIVPTNGKQHEIIVGVDPSLIMKDNEHEGQEMKERGGMPMLSGRKASMQQMSTIDSMDLDQVVEDEHVAEESTAVKRVGFAE